MADSNGTGPWTKYQHQSAPFDLSTMSDAQLEALHSKLLQQQQQPPGLISDAHKAKIQAGTMTPTWENTTPEPPFDPDKFLAETAPAAGEVPKGNGEHRDFLDGIWVGSLGILLITAIFALGYAVGRSRR